MLSSAQIIAFAATANAEASISFYRDVLNLQLVADEPFALVFDSNDVMLRIQKVERVVAVPYTTLGWNVEDIRATRERLVEAGFEFERFENLAQDKDGIVEFPGGAKVAWFKDPDGNLLSLTQGH
jgi:catechol 2,3-dioxygenase-like lactoylglutathione lyase family enzyme